MPKVTKTTQIIEKIVKEEIPEVTITLNYNEARVLKVILGRVSGPSEGPRKVASQINNELANNAGILFSSNNDNIVEGKINFTQTNMADFLDQYYY